MERKRKLLKTTIGLSLPIIVLTAACGDDGQSASTAPSSGAETATSAPRSTSGTAGATTVPATAGPASTAPGTSAPPDTTDSASTAPATETTPGTGGEPVIDPGDGGNYEPNIDPADFVDAIDNPYMPLPVGAEWVYESREDKETEQVKVIVTPKTKQVMGITTTVVRDTVHIDGELVEDTYDWFAQDGDGNVWYLGETVKNYENGRFADSEGSWEAGVDGALPGIVMPADPTEGMAYRQEYWEGEAEDMGEVEDVGGSQAVPAGQFSDVITTTDWNPLEPDVVEEKQYAPGVGLIRETKVAGGKALVELIEFSPPA